MNYPTLPKIYVYTLGSSQTPKIYRVCTLNQKVFDISFFMLALFTFFSVLYGAVHSFVICLLRQSDLATTYNYQTT